MILVTGARGNLGSAVLSALREMGVHARGGSRTAGDGIRPLDFDNAGTLDLGGVSTLVLVSAGEAEDDVVIRRHGAVLDAAKRDGVENVVYTSLTASGDHLAFALAHRATERMLRDSGIAWTILRNGLYAELFGALLMWNDTGLESAFGSGRLSAVARADLAAATAKVAASPATHAGRVYELVGPPVTADQIAEHLGVAHGSISMGDYRDRLLRATGLSPFQPSMLTSIATSIRHGFLDGASPDLENLLGRAPRDPVAVASATASALRPAASA